MIGDGIKFDGGKLRLAEMLQDFEEPIKALCLVWQFGANKYGKSNWKDLDKAVDRYTNALIRHLMTDEVYDEESGILHAAHLAFNALARLHFILKQHRSRHFGGPIGTLTPVSSNMPAEDDKDVQLHIDWNTPVRISDCKNIGG